MASGSNYKVAFRRRREGKTDYATRAKLVGVDKSRLVVRISNANCIVQVIDVDKEGDKTVVSAHSKELNKLGWLAGNKNTSAVYLTAYLCGKKAVAAGIGYAVADIGLKSPIRGSKVFAAVKGAADAGLNVPYGESIIPSEDRINGEHIAEYPLRDRNLGLLVGFQALIEIHAVIGLIGADGAAMHAGKKPLPFHILKIGAHGYLAHAEDAAEARHAHGIVFLQKLQDLLLSLLCRHIAPPFLLFSV